METEFAYQNILNASQPINWRIEDIIGGDKRLDFSKPFMPEALAQVDELEFLSLREKRILNQIRGHEYLAMFGLVEEFIFPFAMESARQQLSGGDCRSRALLEFAAGEEKHIHLFKRLRYEFLEGFDSPCEFVCGAEDTKKFVRSHSSLGIAFAILHIEWTTWRHYIESVRDNQDLDGPFQSLLAHHWLEESQHCQIDTLLVEEMAACATSKETDLAFDDYNKIVAFIEDGIQQQAEFNVVAFEQESRSKLLTNDYEQMFNTVLKAMRWTYLGSGMTHPNFLATVEKIKPAARAQIEAMAP